MRACRPIRECATVSDPHLGIIYYNFNNGNDATGTKKSARCQDVKACPTANKNFRIALTEAIDKQAFIDATVAGLGQVANSFVMPGLPGYDETIDPYPFNLESAKTHMDQALQELGYASAADIPPLKFGFNTGGGHEPRVAFLAEAWRSAFGLETDQIGSEFGVFLTQRTAGEYDVARNGWGADYPHANNQLNGTVHLRRRQQRPAMVQRGIRQPASAGGRGAGSGRSRPSSTSRPRRSWRTTRRRSS